MNLSLTLTALLACWCFEVSALADPKDPYDPKEYIMKQEVENPATSKKAGPQQKSGVKETRVFVNGKEFRRFETNEGVMMMPYSSNVSPEAIREGSVNCRDITGEQQYAAPLAQSETKVAEGTSAYVALVGETLRSRCSGADNGVNSKVHLDIGIGTETKGKNPTKTKVFNRDLKPNINLQHDF